MYTIFDSILAFYVYVGNNLSFVKLFQYFVQADPEEDLGILGVNRIMINSLKKK